MKEMVRRLYDNLIKDMENDGISEWESREIEKLLLAELSGGGMDISIEEIKAISFRAAEIGEEVGFVRGFRYAVQLLAECV